ncbi:hypothetical protein [Elizabethkingia meningoseptica]|uniref:hypothetical protein n=1 Tax=Elizabethkingia meningoseptica TaxID=238 RepID=UPI00301B35FE
MIVIIIIILFLLGILYIVRYFIGGKKTIFLVLGILFVGTIYILFLAKGATQKSFDKIDKLKLKRLMVTYSDNYSSTQREFLYDPLHQFYRIDSLECTTKNSIDSCFSGKYVDEIKLIKNLASLNISVARYTNIGMSKTFVFYYFDPTLKNSSWGLGPTDHDDKFVFLKEKIIDLKEFKKHHSIIKDSDDLLFCTDNPNWRNEK